MKISEQRLSKADKTIGIVMNIISFLAIAGAAVILIATILNIVLRNFFNLSLNGMLELSTDMMVLVAFCALPAVTFFRGHIKVDLVVRKLPERLQRVLRGFNLFVVSGLCCLSAIYIFERGIRMKELGSVSGASLRLPVYPFYYMIAVMMFISMLCTLYLLVHLILTGEEGDEGIRNDI